MIGVLSNEEIEQVLQRNVLGRIGCTDNKRIYVVPVSYFYDGRYLVAHSIEGMKIRFMRKNPQVCFQVDEVDDFANWRSIIAWGTYEEVSDEKLRYDLMKQFVDRFMRMKVSETAVPPEVHAQRVHPRSPGNIKPVIYRIELLEKTGRYEKS